MSFICSLFLTGNYSYLFGEQLGRNQHESYFIGLVIFCCLCVLPRFSILLSEKMSIICRDGVSEGQFYQVLLYELDAIRKVNLLFGLLFPSYLFLHLYVEVRISFGHT
jgi:hypothetical protein